MRRPGYLHDLKQAFRTSPVVAILGPRQSGKTTLAQEYFQRANQGIENYFDLENPLDLARLQEPMLTLQGLDGLIVIDEIQRLPELFPVLRVLVDQQDSKRRLLILGSAARDLIQQSSESLAGRIQYLELTPFSFAETQELPQLWLRGGFPPAYLAATEQDSIQWRKNYIRTFLEQDIPNLGIRVPPQNLRRFWMMLAHYHGQLFNASALGNSLDLSHNTIRKYLDILVGTFMLRQLPPWYANIAKRQVKTSKVYFRDSGIYHALLNLQSQAELTVNPNLGASWEGFAMESVIRHLRAEPEECYFWAVHNQAELDLLIVRGQQRLGFEFKYTAAPKLTRAMQTAAATLKLTGLVVIYPGDKAFPLAQQIECIPLHQFLSKGSSI